ncbi:MAG TPA: hypothetical protein VN327_04750, partial [Pseudonocardiaceae bacterium]|nr:hypothetical protein [Pseudonocardiaceae bacterium]
PEEPLVHPNPPGRGRCKAIPATCALHRDPVGFANLLVSMRDRTIVLNPHRWRLHDALDKRPLSDEQSAKTQRNTLTEWLG